MIQIKNFNETNEEFKELARIDNLVNHNSISHPDDDKREWNIRDKNIIRNRLLLYKDNTLIGVLYYSQGRAENSKTAFYTLNLDPDYNNQGFRKLLFDKLLIEVKAFNCNLVHTSIYEHPNYSEHKKLLVKEGFKLVQTNREYSCDIRKIDLKKYKNLISRLDKNGIKFYDSKEEMVDNDKKFPNHFKKLENLEWMLEKDIPIPDGIKHTRMPFNHWQKVCLDFYNNSYGVDIVAVKNKEYIGSTYLEVYPKAEPHKAWTGHLGVVRKFRRQGIATALKIKAIEKLLHKGVTEVRTDNEENNPMYKINIGLGFEPVPFSYDYSKEL